jgi:macrolide transport system ATP-binding/permease protein
MGFRAWIANLVRNFTQGRRVDRDLDEEVRGAFEIFVDEKARAGLSHASARRAAALEFGGVEQVKEKIRDIRAGALLEAVGRDVRYACRMLVKSPGFTFVAITTLALGIGANTTIFGFVYAVVLKPLPLENLPRLVTVYMTDARNPGERGMSLKNFVDFRDRNDVFEAMTSEGFATVSLAGGNGEPDRVLAELVAGNYFATLGIKPILGRTFLPEEDRTEGASLVAVLSYPLWQSRFGGDPAVVGGTMSVNNHAFTIVGVMPPEFRGIESVGGAALWVPTMTYPVTTTGQTLQGVPSRRFDYFLATGLLKPGGTLPQAEANLKAIARQLEQAFPNDNGGRSVGVRRLGISPDERRTIATSVGLLMTIVGLVLFIACANVANLMLARATVRQKEMAIRLTLGASRWRLMRQLFTEGLLLALIGGLAGLLLARWAQDLVWSYRPPGVGAGDIDLRLNVQVLGFTLIVSMLTCVLFSLVPVMRASRPDVVGELKGTTSHIGGGGRRRNLRHTLIAVQVALSLVALVSAGLFIRSFQAARQIVLGFDVADLAAMRFELAAQGYTQGQGREFQRQAIERATAVNGVQSAALADLVPLSGGGQTRTVFIEGEDLRESRNGRIVPTGIVGASYFKTLGIPLVRGRGFDERDQSTAPLVAIVNERLANLLWPGQEALGKRVKLFNTDFHQVVGIVRNSRYGSLGSESPPILYRPLTQVYQSNLALLIRSKNPDAVIGTVRSQLGQLDEKLPITNVSTLSDVFYSALWAPRMAAWLLTLLGGVSLLLAVVGIYGVMAYSVSQRTRELGIRMALGALRRDVIRLIIGQSLRLSFIGMTAGLGVSLIAARFIAGLLYGSALDPVTFVSVPLVLAAAVVVASYLPARRATRIEPTIALRSDL